MDHRAYTEIEPLGELIYKFVDVHRVSLPGYALSLPLTDYK